MKKVLAMVLAVFMLVSVLCVGVSADTALTFTVDSVSASAGRTVSVAVNIQNNPGLVGLRLNVGYDAGVLTPIDAVGQGSYSLATFGPLDVNPLSVMWVDAIHPDVTENGAVALITFQVAEDAPVGEYPLTLDVADPEDIFASGDNPGSFNVVAFETIDGAVTVVDFTYGDVNDDGKVNVRDLGVMQQHLNGWSVEINVSAADVNADGKVNVRDLGIMQQHLNGWDVNLGGGTVTPPVDPDPQPPVDPEPPVNDWTVATTLKAGVAYKLGLNQTAKGAVYYFVGTMSTYYGATDTAVDNAVDMYLEDADGGYKLYFNDANGAKQYIKLVQSGTHYNFTYGAEGSVFTLDTERNALCAPCGDQICYMGTYGNYVTVGTLTSEKLKDTDYIARLYESVSGDIGGGDTPSVPSVPSEPAGDLSVEDAPVVGTAYKFGMVQQKVSATSVYYLTGAMNGYYMDTTTSADAAVDVYLEETSGGYYLYTMNEKGTKYYINMVVSGTHVNGQFGAATATTVYTFDTESYTLIAEIDGIPYWFGTRSDMTYTTVGPVKVEYAGFYCQLYA